MSFLSIIYDESTQHPLEGYKGVSVSFAQAPKYSKVFFANDFIKDWFHAMQHILETYQELGITDLMYSYSSSVDHFIMDGAPYRSAYLHSLENDEWILKYYDPTDPEWFKYEVIRGIEFFVKVGEQPTWKELKAYCKS